MISRRTLFKEAVAVAAVTALVPIAKLLPRARKLRVVRFPEFRGYDALGWPQFGLVDLLVEDEARLPISEDGHLLLSDGRPYSPPPNPAQIFWCGD